MTDRIPLDAGSSRHAMGGEIASDELTADLGANMDQRRDPSDLWSAIAAVTARFDAQAEEIERLRRENADIEVMRAEQWRKRREAEADRDTAYAVAETIRSELAAAKARLEKADRVIEPFAEFIRAADETPPELQQPDDMGVLTARKSARLNLTFGHFRAAARYKADKS